MVASDGVGRLRATQGWQCQEFLAFAAPSPLKIGTARDFWRRAGFRHPVLALPGIAGSLAGFRHPVLALPGIAGLRPLRSPRAPRPRARNRTVV